METKNNSFSVVGNILAVFDPKAAGQYKIQEFVVQTKEEYPQSVKFEVFENRIRILEGLRVGQEVEVFFSVRGREYNGNYYNNLRAWKINAKKNTGIKQPTSKPAAKPSTTKQAPPAPVQPSAVETPEVETLTEEPVF
jgi:hypothetical protein